MRKDEDEIGLWDIEPETSRRIRKMSGLAQKVSLGPVEDMINIDAVRKAAARFRQDPLGYKPRYVLLRSLRDVRECGIPLRSHYSELTSKRLYRYYQSVRRDVLQKDAQVT